MISTAGATWAQGLSIGPVTAYPPTGFVLAGWVLLLGLWAAVLVARFGLPPKRLELGGWQAALYVIAGMLPMILFFVPPSTARTVLLFCSATVLLTTAIMHRTPTGNGSADADPSGQSPRP